MIWKELKILKEYQGSQTVFLKKSATTQKHEKAARIILKNPKGSFAKKMKESGKIWKDLGKIKKSEEI